jgi:hypothetical protein
MSRIARFAVGGLLVIVGIPLSAVIAALLFGLRDLPSDSAPVDATVLPPDLYRVLWVFFGGAPDESPSIGLTPFFLGINRQSKDLFAWVPEARVPSHAANHLLRRERDDWSQLEWNLAQPIASLYVASHWSAREALAEIATREYFGHGFRGIEAAANGYFGRPTLELRTLEIATLVALSHSPSRLSPWCKPGALLERTRELMVRLGEAPPESLPEFQPVPPGACGTAWSPPNKALQLTPNSLFQSVRGAILAAGGSVPTLAVSAVWCS